MMQQQVDKWQNQLIQTDELLQANVQANTRDLMAYSYQAQRLFLKRQSVAKMHLQLQYMQERLKLAEEQAAYAVDALVEASADLQMLQQNRRHHMEITGMRQELLDKQEALAQAKRETEILTYQTATKQEQAALNEKDAGRLLATAQRKLAEQQ